VFPEAVKGTFPQIPVPFSASGAKSADFGQNLEKAAINSAIATGPEGSAWAHERAVRVAKLRRLHQKDRQEKLGLDPDQMAAECGIPSDVARGLREQW
jgi:hypothetical protein